MCIEIEILETEKNGIYLICSDFDGTRKQRVQTFRLLENALKHSEWQHIVKKILTKREM